MSIAIEFSHVSKQYRLGLVSTRTLKHDLNRWFTVNVLRKDDPYLKIGESNDRAHKGNSDYVWALRDIDFSIEQGDVVGIIGKNGAGKSTLLKLLSKVTTPTTGIIKANGRIASLLEVGTGFHPEMTGRENIYLNGAIMGMTRSEINRKLDEIISFSGCERYIDTPVKRYSSGMTVRLGFAVAAHLDPEILVVDEVLAVGDAEFQKKAIGKMQDVAKGEGRTVLFVSHNMGSIRRLCNKGVLLEDGTVAYRGTASDTINHYLENQADITEYTAPKSFTGAKIILENAKVYPAHGKTFFNTQDIIVDFRVRINHDIPSLVIGFNVYSMYQYPIARTDYNDVNGITTLNKGVYDFRFIIPGYTFSNGDYRIKFDIAERNIKNYAPEQSDLSLHVETDSTNYGNTFSEEMPIKTSLIRSRWLSEYTKVE